MLMIPILFVVGIILGIKIYLWAQLVIPVAFIMVACESQGKGVGEEVFGLIALALVGMGAIVGDLIYYCNFYQGGNTISGVIGWFFHP